MAQEQPEIYILSPSSAEEAGEILREATALARKGVQVRVGVIQSPYLRYETSGPQMPAEDSKIPPELASKGGTILLGHDRMNGIVEVSKPDLLAVVEGGVRYWELAAAIAEEGLRFPHTPETDMTLAEMVMDGTIFPTEGRFGSLREYILSLELVTPTGETVRFGSRAIKDVGGYELIGFLLGQGARCGYISSVTLRLLPEPYCKAYVAGTGDVRTLKTLAHNARREIRLSSMVIYEGEAAAFVTGLWREALGKRGKTLPPLLDAGDKDKENALLIGEIEGLEHVVEDQLHALAGTDALSGASLALLEGELFGISKKFLHAAIEKLDRRGSVVYLSYDGGAHAAPPAGSFIYRSLYPERINAVVPILYNEAAASPMELIEADPSLRLFLGVLEGMLRRERIYVIECEGETTRRVRIPEEDLLGLATGEDAVERIERTKALNEVNDKVFRVFDPESIMLP